VGGAAAGESGTILVEKDLVKVVCGESSQLEIMSVKQEGRKEISAGEFLRGARVVEGERFGK
jgi:methionyl-tRNA formyltransferase